MALSRKPFEERLHPRGFGGKFGHGTGTKKAPAAKAPARKYTAADVASGSALKKRPPVAAQKGDFWKGSFGPPKKGAGPAKAVPKAKTAPKKAAAPQRGDWKIVKANKNGKPVSIVNDVATLSEPVDFDAPENIDNRLTDEQRALARVKARKIFENAVDKAPAIRAAIRGVVDEHDGQMGREYDEKTGAPTAVKTEHSTWRKVQLKMADKGLATPDDVSLGDSVRFTALFDEENYAEAVQSMRDALEGLGYTMNEPPPDINDGKGGWALGAYRGLNMTFQNDDGFVYEVQVHTPASLKVASLNHSLYDIVRNKDDESLIKVMADKGPKGGKAKTGIDPAGMTPAQYRAEANKIMFRQAESIPIPKNVAVLAKKDAWGQVIKVTRKTGYHSATTGKGMAKPKKTDRVVKQGPLKSDALDIDAMSTTLGGHYDETDAAFRKIGKDWYPEAGRWADAQTKGTKYTKEQAAAIVAAFSPNTSWSDNLRLASNYLHGKKAATMTDNIERAHRVRDMVDIHADPTGDPINSLPGFDPDEALKITNFTRNILGDEHAVTVDRWAIRAALNVDGATAQKMLGQKGTYNKVAEAYRRAAANAGITPAAMQAIVWGKVRGGYD